MREWSPDLQFIHDYILFVQNCLDYLLKHPDLDTLPTLHAWYTRFLSKRLSIFHKDGSPRYRAIARSHLPEWFAADSDEITPISLDPDDTPSTYLRRELARSKHLCHHKQAKIKRAKITKHTALLEEAVALGKLNKACAYVLQRDTTRLIPLTVTTDGSPCPDLLDAHTATCSHYQDHFAGVSPWLTLSSLNEDTPEGQAGRDALLSGTWRASHPHLLDTFTDPKERLVAETYLDEFKIKPSPQMCTDISALWYAPIPYEAFRARIFNRLATTTPGPSGLTISALQALPDPFLQHMHALLSIMWQHRHVPSSWRTRELCPIPKSPTSTKLNEFRPIFLLEILRKEWLTLVLNRHIEYLQTHNLLNTSQSGGLASRGTEDAILQLRNALEDAHDNANPMHLLAFDKAKAFDSPGRLSGIYMAWRRLGMPDDVARYLISCDEGNQIFPRTPYYLLNKSEALPFTAQLGTPQGCSSACSSYIMVEDIILSVFLTNCSTTLTPTSSSYQMGCYTLKNQPSLSMTPMCVLGP